MTRLTSTGDMDFRIARQLKFYRKQDPPPARVKPIPVPVLHWISHAASLSPHCSSHAIADMAVLAFFFLLRPGEYTSSTTDSSPFRLADLRLAIGSQYLDLATAPNASLDAATFLSLTFTTQKNGVRGEVIGLGRSGSSSLCPVLAAVRRVKHLRTHGAQPHTPISSYFDRMWRRVSPSDITAVLQTAVLAIGTTTLGFLPTDVTARSLRAAGAMALLCGHVDTDTIRLLGRWRSDEMLRYLHLQAEPVMRNFSRTMLTGGAYSLHPNAGIPQVPPP